MSTCYFWDWSPVSAAPWMSFTYETQTFYPHENKLYRYGSDLPPSLQYWMRSDGIFVFRVEIMGGLADRVDARVKELFEKAKNTGATDVTEDALRLKQYVKIAKLISGQIKESVSGRAHAHGMLLPKRASGRRTFRSISISPRKISSNALNTFGSDDKIRDFLSSKVNLISLCGREMGARLDIEAPVALLLRQQFSAVFDAAFVAANKIKYKHISVPRRVMRDGKKSFERNAYKIYWQSIRVIFISYLASVLMLSVAMLIATSAVQPEGILLSVKRAFEAAQLAFVVLTAAFLTLFLVIDTFFKRLPTLKAYNNAQALLISGNTYCDVVRNLVSTVEKHQDTLKEKPQDRPIVLDGCLNENLFSRIEAEGDFSNAIDTLDVWKRRQYQKIALTQILCIPAILFTTGPLLQFLENTWPAVYSAVKTAASYFGIELP